MARALLVDLLHAAEIGWAEVAPSAWRAIRFLESAFADDSGRVRNFRGTAGDWLIGPSSEDAHARAMMALGQAAGVVANDRFRSLAISLFQRGLPGTAQLRYLRPQAAVLIGCAAAGPERSRRGDGGHLPAVGGDPLVRGRVGDDSRSVAVAGDRADV